MKYEKHSKSNFFKSRGFYLIIAVCLLAIGAVSWLAYDRIEEETYPEPEQLVGENSSEETPSNDTESEEAPSADNVGTDKNDEPYESSSSESEPTPIAPPVANNFVLPLLGNIQKHFSGDTLVYSETYKDMRLHSGIDISAAEDSDINSCGVGTVISVIDDVRLGKYIEIDHGNNLMARYCGFKDISVQEGETVNAVTKLGTLGEVIDECLDSPHLHLEFYKDDAAVDPLSVIYPEN